MNESNDPQKPKIIIDEDWKTQVEREREEAASQPAADENAPESTPEAGQIPPASINSLITQIATQAAAAMGAMPIPGAEQHPPNFELARHFIDTLDVIQEKTKGNLSQEEEEGLANVLNEMRMLFVTVQSQT